MKAHAICETNGTVSLSLQPETTEEMERLAEVFIYAGQAEHEATADDTPETFGFEVASAYGESDKHIYAVASGREGEVVTDKKSRNPHVEIRLWRKE